MKTTINLCLNELTVNQPSLSKLVENKSKHRILHSYWPVNRGKNNKKNAHRDGRKVAAAA